MKFRTAACGVLINLSILAIGAHADEPGGATDIKQPLTPSTVPATGAQSDALFNQAAPTSNTGPVRFPASIDPAPEMLDPSMLGLGCASGD